MTISFYIECNDCNTQYRIRYGVGNNYPQLASFQCYECSKQIDTGYEEFKGEFILRGAKEIKDDDLHKKGIKVINLHPEIPTQKGRENDPSLFQTIELFDHLIKDNTSEIDVFKNFKKEQIIWSQFNSFWNDLEKPLRIISSKDEIKLMKICNINFNELTVKFNSWFSIFISGEKLSNFELIKNEFNSLNTSEISRYVKSENKFLKKIYTLCNTYMKNSHQFQSTIFHQKYGWEIDDTMFVNVNWELIETVYGDLYEIIGDLFIIPTMMNNVKNNRDFDEFQTNGFTLTKYLKTDKANRANNFSENPNLAFLSENYFSWLRNGTHHKNSTYNTETHEIHLGTGKGGGTEKKIAVIEYIKNCNELFEVGIILSSLILEMKK